MIIFESHILPWEVDGDGNTISYDIHCDSCTFAESADTKDALEKKLTELGWKVVEDEVWCKGCVGNNAA